MSNFHTHTYYSVRDAIQSPESIALFQKESGKDWFAVSDHGSMSSHQEAFEAAKKHGMKFFAGCEFYVKPDDAFDAKMNVIKIKELTKKLKLKKLDPEVRAELEDELQSIVTTRGHDTAYYHVTAIAFNQEGLHNLYRINNDGDFYFKNRVKKENLLKYNEGLVILSGCPAGEFLKMIEYGYEDLAVQWIKDFQAAYGDRVYFELMFHDGVYEVDPIPGETKDQHTARRIAREKEIYARGIELAKANGMKIIGSNDSHYTTPLDKKNWMITRKAFAGNAYEFIGEYHLLPSNDIFEEAYPGLITEAELDEAEAEIVARYEPYDLFRSTYESTWEDQVDLERLIWTGFKKIREGTEEEVDSLLQIPYELAVIQMKGFDKYFLKTREIVKSAFEKGVLVGPGRGSGAGSECVFLLGITKTDPIKYGLMFERFLNPGRNAMPDIDLDLCSTSCKNFKPNEEYKKMFFASHEELVSDEEIDAYWEKYVALKKEHGDYRRDEVLKSMGHEPFDAFIAHVKDMHSTR